jgi:hypothetical protein
MLDRLAKQKEEIENLIKSYQNTQAPVNNYINTNQTPNKELIEWRILNENEEVDNLYVQNKTLFISDNLMILKGVDGKLEKWEIKKIYPIDKKDEKINELTLKIEDLERRLSNEHTKSNEPTSERIKPNVNVNEYVEPKSKANGKSISKQE